MEIRIRFHDLDRSQMLVEYATRRLQHHLGRFDRTVQRAVLRVSDVNGPRGGHDKRCRLALSGPEIGVVILTDTQGDPYAAVELVAYRARRALGEARARRQAGGETVRRAAAHLRLLPGADG